MFEYRGNIGPWFRGFFLFSPDASLMVGVPLTFQLHNLSASLLFALWPFSSLVHAFSLPLGYFRRRNIQTRSRDSQTTRARERNRREGGKPPKAERSRRVE